MNISYSKIPYDQTSDFMENLLWVQASGAVHFTGNFVAVIQKYFICVKYKIKPINLKSSNLYISRFLSPDQKVYNNFIIIKLLHTLSSGDKNLEI